jgi:hypothetical protein
MDYKLHTQQRFVEKFIPISKKKSKTFWENTGGDRGPSIDWVEITDEDYSNICKMCLENPLFSQPERRRVIIKYRNTFMWCAMTKKSKIVKTIYPIDRADVRKYLNNG